MVAIATVLVLVIVIASLLLKSVVTKRIGPHLQGCEFFVCGFSNVLTTKSSASMMIYGEQQIMPKTAPQHGR